MGKKNRRRQTKKGPSVETTASSSVTVFPPEDWRSAPQIAAQREANVTTMFESQIKQCRSSPPLEQVMHMLELSEKTEKAAFHAAGVKVLYECTIEMRTILPPVPPSLALPLSMTNFIKWFELLKRLQFFPFLVTEALELLQGQMSEAYRIVLLGLIFFIVTPQLEVPLESPAVDLYFDGGIELCMRKISEDTEEPFFIRAMAMAIRASLLEDRALLTGGACYKRRACIFTERARSGGEMVPGDNLVLPLFKESENCGLFKLLACPLVAIKAMMGEITRTLRFEAGPSVPSILECKEDNQQIISRIQTGEFDVFGQYSNRVGGRSCDRCGKRALTDTLPMLLMCSACRLAHYCSRECQAKAWESGHRSCCKKFGRFFPGDRVIVQRLTGDDSTYNGWLAVVVAKEASSKLIVVDVISDRYVSGDVSAVRRLSVPKKNLRHLRPMA